MSKLLKKINRNKKFNSWWIILFRDRIAKWLKNKMPDQTIGVFLNVYTSNKERLELLRRFKII